MYRFSKLFYRDSPTPEELALEEIYDDIVGNLMLCPDQHCPEGLLRPPNSSVLSLMNPQLMTSEYLINLIRERLNQKLSGSSEETRAITRKRLVKLYSLMATTNSSLDRVDIWAFFDCVLDESFEELKTRVKTSAKLMSTIAKRSPYLKMLKLSFQFDRDQSSPQLVPMIKSLDSLHHLTSLTLAYLGDRFDGNSVLTLIGKGCPSLSHLRLSYSGRPTSKHDILAIILGELVDHLIGPLEHYKEELCWRYKKVDWAEDAALGRLRVPSEFLTSLCFSLCHLEIDEHLDDRCQNPSIDPEIAAVILRHMPLLKKLESRLGTSTGSEKAVHLLHKETEEAEESYSGSIQVDFERACRDAVKLHGLDLRNPREPEKRPSSTFFGTLSLTTLEYVNLTDESIAGMLGAIRLTCPCMRDVTFGEKREESLTPPASKRALLDTDERQQLELELGKWPKLETITFVKVSPANIQTILNVFHKELKEVSFIECNLINLTDLERCTQLQSLRISSTCSLNSYENVPALSADTFLPNLKRFSSKICLGAVSALFEEKSTLNWLHLKCCHMHIQECIQLKWRYLETLHLQRCSGLVDTDMVLHLIDELPDLKEIFLDGGLEDPNGRMNEIRRIANAYVMPTPINIKLKFRHYVRCLLDPMS